MSEQGMSKPTAAPMDESMLRMQVLGLTHRDDSDTDKTWIQRVDNVYRWVRDGDIPTDN